MHVLMLIALSFLIFSYLSDFLTFTFFFSWTLIHDCTLKHIKMGYHKLACFGRSEIIVFQELHIEGTFQYRIPLIHLNLAMNCSFFHLYLL